MNKKQKYKKCINKGILEPLSKLPFHNAYEVPIKRYVLLNNKILPKSNIHIAIHFIKKIKKFKKYTTPHKHNCNEINLILSEKKNSLVYNITLGKENYKVSSPVSIFVPKGISHCANVIKGKGIFITILLKGNYLKSLKK